MDEQLRKLQNTQLEILKVINAFCERHKIPYSLYAGTLLGAVRHQGFIPWDDDLDICMSRENYRRFLSAWEKDPQKGYILQNKENTPEFTQTFSKIRKDHTTFLQFDWERGRYHTGIFVDVFPIDRLPDGFILRRRFQWTCLKYLLLTREFVPEKENVLVRAFSRLVLLAVPVSRRHAIRKRLIDKIETMGKNGANCVATETRQTLFNPLPGEMMDAYVELPFENGTFLCTATWKLYLEFKYGDFLTLPPESERLWKHHPIVLSFEHNLDEL